MAKGISLHFGVPFVDPLEYGRLERLDGPANDAAAMAELAARHQFTGVRLEAPNELHVPMAVTGRSATRDVILRSIELAGAHVEAGDFVLVTFAGHGARTSNERTPDEEEDGFDDFWCAFDKPVIDDELFERFAQFPERVRILVIADACFSGTITELHSEGVARTLPADAVARVVANNRVLFDELDGRLLGGRPTLKAALMLLAACSETEKTGDGCPFGDFTNALLIAEGEGTFTGTHKQFRDAIAGALPSNKPVYSLKGGTNPDFETQPIFRI